MTRGVQYFVMAVENPQEVYGGKWSDLGHSTFGGSSRVEYPEQGYALIIKIEYGLNNDTDGRGTCIVKTIEIPVKKVSQDESNANNL